jgi:DNA repair protein SbcD/Mre11
MKLVHLADLHLGYRAYQRLTGAGLNRREVDVFTAFREALDKIVEINPDLVLMAGDIFHVPHPSNAALIQAQKLLLSFRQRCKSEIVAIAGNHESIRTAGNRCILELLTLIPQVQVVTDRPEIILAASDRLKITCLPHNALIQGNQIESIAPQSDCDFNILMLHGTVDSDRINDYGGYDVPAKILAMPWDYVACGHFHSHTHLGNNAYYAGAIERTSNDIWKEADEQKGIIEFDLDRHLAKFHSLKSPRATVDLAPIDASDKTAEQINQLIATQAIAAQITDKIVRQRVINLAKSVQLQLDHRQIRQFQAEAVHYLFDPRPPVAEEKPAFAQTTKNSPSGGLIEDAQLFFTQQTLPTELNRDSFVSKALSYLQT